MGTLDGWLTTNVRLARELGRAPRAAGGARMMSLFRREWGAITFVATVLIGAVVVAISFAIGAGHRVGQPSLPPCPSYTPWQTPSAGATATATPFAFANCPTPPPEADPEPQPDAHPEPDLRGVGIRLRLGVGLRIGIRIGIRLGLRVGQGVRLGVGLRVGQGVRLGVGLRVSVGEGVRLGEPDRDLVAGQASLRPHAVPLSVAPALRSPATAGPPLRRRPHLA